MKTEKNNWTLIVWDADLQDYHEMKRLKNEKPDINKLIAQFNVSKIKITLATGDTITLIKGQNVDTYA